MAIETHKDLDVWQLAILLAEDSYRLTAHFPKDELYGMTSQIRRASVSIPANIAEGFGRDQTGAYIQFLRIAQGSARELETHLILAVKLALAPEAEVRPVQEKCDRVGRMLRALIRSLEARRTANE